MPRLNGHARALAAVALLAAVAGCGSTGAAPGTSTRAQPETVTVLAGGRRLFRVAVPASTAPGAEARAIARRLPRRIAVRRGRATIDLVLSRAAATAAAERALAAHRPRVAVPVRAVSTSIALRPVRQVLRNDCEATALSMLLTAAGVHVSQLRLQHELPIAKPLDPEPIPGSQLRRWGDPEQGFVGRADGRGAGGFGVYEPPVRALAARHGVRVVDLHGRPFSAVRTLLLAGRPVLAWVGLAEGPYMSWLTPTGRKVTVNLNEHAILLVGAGPGYVLVNDPLTGTRVRWSDALFSVRWRRLGRRALGLPDS